MGIGFEKFQRKMRRGGILRAVLFGLSLGLLTAAGLWLWDKLTSQPADFARYALFAAIPTVLGGGALLPVLLPTKKRLAKRLDRVLDLGEKVQTMVAFREDPSTMAAYQRQDADRILATTPKRRVKGVCTWLFVVLPVIAGLCLVGTILVPAKTPEPPPAAVDNTYSLTPWQEQALKDLIEEVRTSDMEETPKEAVVKQLESLLIRIKTVKKESAMKQTVSETIVAIHGIVEDHNTYDILAEALRGSTADAVYHLGTAMESGQLLLVGDSVKEMTELLQEDRTAAVELKAALEQALTRAGGRAEPTMTAVLTEFAVGLGGVTAETDDEAITLLISLAEEALNSALKPQYTNEDVVESAIYRLMTIFGLSTADVPADVFAGSSEEDGREDDYEDKDDEEEKSDVGGLGTGDRVVAADDEIYHHDSLGYKPYAELIDEYSAMISALEVDGKIDSELAEIIKDYIALLNRP